jgi:5-deoxy-glucuronate isomerase
MPEFIKSYNNKNKPIVDASTECMDLSYFNLVQLKAGKTYKTKVSDYETVWVVMHGNCNIQVNDLEFTNVGKRKDIWTGKAESVYAPIKSNIEVKANTDVEIAVGGGLCDTEHEPFFIGKDDVKMVDVGSSDTKSHRQIFHILGQHHKGRCGRLLVSELWAEEGCWSGYPPHKHDVDNLPEETDFEEIYHYRFSPDTGFGGQYLMLEDGTETCFVTRNGDTFAFEKGYHPTSTSPGHRGYIFTILVGRTQESLVQNFKEEHRHLMDKIPGIKDMRDLFK